MKYRDTLIEANEAANYTDSEVALMTILTRKAFAILTEKDLEEAERQHERLMQGWMNDLDQDDQAIREFCDAD